MMYSIHEPNWSIKGMAHWGTFIGTAWLDTRYTDEQVLQIVRKQHSRDRVIPADAVVNTYGRLIVVSSPDFETQYSDLYPYSKEHRKHT